MRSGSSGWRSSGASRSLQGGRDQSSPSWLHRDEEAFVAVVLCALSYNLGGGDYVIARPKRGISDAFRMTERLDMLLLTKACSHAVTPMHSTDGRQARRDILLITFS
jgi:hypothetical protein